MYRLAHDQTLSNTRIGLILADVLCFNSAFIAAFYWAKSSGWVSAEAVQSNFYAMWTLFDLLGLISVLHLRLYARDTIKQLRKVKCASWKSVITLLLVFTGCTFLEHRFAGVYYLLVIMAALVIVYVMLSRFLLTYMYMRHTRAASFFSNRESFR